MSGRFSDQSEQEKLNAEEERYNRHFAQRKEWGDRHKQVVNCTTTIKAPQSSSSRGRRIVIYWIDRTSGGRVVEPMSVELDPMGRFPLNFVKAEWQCDNMVLKQGNLTLKPGPDGYSFQIMPNDGHIEFYADDVARVKRVVSKPHTEIEIVTDLPAPNLPGMGLRTNEYVQNLNMPAPAAAGAPQAQFCSSCGGKIPVAGARFCLFCGGKLF